MIFNKTADHNDCGDDNGCGDDSDCGDHNGCGDDCHDKVSPDSVTVSGGESVYLAQVDLQNLKKSL